MPPQALHAAKDVALWGTMGGDSLATTAEDGDVLAQNGEGGAGDSDDHVEGQ